MLAAPPAGDSHRWWHFGFGSPGWSFAGACALAAAIVFHALWAPASAEPVHTALAPVADGQFAGAQPAAIPTEPDDARIQALVTARVATAMTTVREELDASHRQETARMVHAAEHRLRTEHEQELTQVREAMIYLNKQYGRQLVNNVALVTELQSRELQ